MYYEGGCWGWIPAFAPDPVLVRQELTVRRVLGPLGQLRRLDSTLGVKDNLSLDYHPRASTGEEDSALVPTITQSDDAQSLEDRSSTFGHASIEWTPLKDVSVRLPGLITAAQSFVPVHVQVKGGLHKEFKVQQLSLSLVQHQTLYFK